MNTSEVGEQGEGDCCGPEGSIQLELEAAVGDDDKDGGDDFFAQ